MTHRTTDDPRTAGQSAHSEYERRRATRRARARARYGPFGSLLTALTGDPADVYAWQQGANGEADTARQLEAHLRRTTVALLHDRRMPGRGRANIDHLAIGPGGVTVIDSKSTHGRVLVTTVGLLKRREVLLVNGRDRTRELERVERQVHTVTDKLARIGIDAGEARGALCFPYMQRAWLHCNRTRRGLIVVDDPRHVAKLARRPGPLSEGDIAELSHVIAEMFPPAAR